METCVLVRMRVSPSCVCGWYARSHVLAWQVVLMMEGGGDDDGNFYGSDSGGGRLTALEYFCGIPLLELRQDR